jgi:hypothetical protein
MSVAITRTTLKVLRVKVTFGKGFFDLLGRSNQETRAHQRNDIADCVQERESENVACA